jgi:pimeloyl-ACP methyl ester carboxylesterase
MGAISDEQARRVGELVVSAGEPFEYVDLPDMAHAMHVQDPELFTRLLLDWSRTLVPTNSPRA